MCGIVGIAAQVAVARREVLVAGRDALRHRGPDDAGEWWSPDGRVGFGHRRLSIIDLSPGGHQPMENERRDLVVAFNGEIYNYRELREELQRSGYRFRSSSDTEVLLAAYDAWGADCLARLGGMFAFAIYDARRQVVFAARDRAGEKPFFYRHAGGELRFASELKGLLADAALPRSVDAEALDCYLANGYVPGARCILAGYAKLPPAHALRFDLASGALAVWPYWQLPAPAAEAMPGSLDERALGEELEALLESSVRRQLVADVPVGVLLSGGVDSSLITAMAARAAKRVKTFTIGMPEHAALDETAHARLIARHFGTDHTELVAEPSTAELLPLLAGAFDEPMADSSMIPTFLVSRLVRRHCPVALGGDGGDELFGGYGHYSQLLQMQRRAARIPRTLRRGVALAAEHLLPVGLRGRNWLQGLDADLANGLPRRAAFFDPATRRKLMAAYSPGWRTAGETIFAQRVPAQPDLLQRATRMDFGNYLPEDILVKVDRASMLNSLEIRAPFLDHPLIEFAYGRVPSRLKTSTVDRKMLLKQLAGRLLPPEFDRQRKQGFSVPLAAWLRDGPFRRLFDEVLLDAGCAFAPDTVRGLLQGQRSGRSNSERLFALVMFELWRRQYAITM